VKEFICLSCWETFEIAISDVRGKDSVDCLHCGAAQEILDDVVEVNQGNLDDTPAEKAVDETKGSGSISDDVVDEFISQSGLEDHNDGLSLAADQIDEAPVEETNEPGIEIESTLFESSETIDPGSLGIDPLEEEQGSDMEDPGVDLLMDTEIEEDEGRLEGFAIDSAIEAILEEAEEPLEAVYTESQSDAELSDEDPPPPLDEPEIGSEYSKENMAENQALSKSVQELVDSITERDLKLPEKEANELSLSHEGEDIAGADTLNELLLDEGLFTDKNAIEGIELAAQFDDAGGLDFELEGLEDVLLSAQTDEEVPENLEPIPTLVEKPEKPEEPKEPEEPEEPEAMDFVLVSDDDDMEQDEPSEEKPLADGIDEDELAEAVSELFEESSDDDDGTDEANEKDGKVKSWRVRLKSGLILSFPSLIVVQGWAADKDTSTIGLARGDGEFKPYEQVLGMMQTIETKALNPSKINAQEEEELIDGLSAAARAAAKRRRDGKMENITAEYQFRKDVYRSQKTSSKKGPLLVLALLVLLAGAAVAVEFLGVVDLGLGFAPAPTAAPSPAPVVPKKTGPNFNLSKTAAPKGVTGKVSKTPKSPSSVMKEKAVKAPATPSPKATKKTADKKKKKKKKR
jgi:hypothetical protein